MLGAKEPVRDYKIKFAGIHIGLKEHSLRKAKPQKKGKKSVNSHRKVLSAVGLGLGLGLMLLTPIIWGRIVKNVIYVTSSQLVLKGKRPCGQ